MDLTRFYARAGERPLDVIPEDGGFAGIFRTIGCIGDSLSSGEFESFENGSRGYHDMFEYSWGQYLGRMIGSKVLNFSRGGMTAREYCRNFAEANGFWNPDLWCQAYLIALGVNDLVNCNDPIGTVDDIKDDWRDNAPTFAGWYGQIIQRYREIEPRSRFFLVTMLHEETDAFNEKTDAQTKLLYEIAAHFPYTYVIDLAAYGPRIDAEYRRNFFMGGHLSPTGYILTAKMIASYMDFIIRNNPEDFFQVPFLHTDTHNESYKW